jgi:hypothetical protein
MIREDLPEPKDEKYEHHSSNRAMSQELYQKKKHTRGWPSNHLSGTGVFYSDDGLFRQRRGRWHQPAA